MQYKVCDAHCDTLSHLVSVGTLENATITPERLAAGGVSLQVFALFATYGRGIEPYEKARRMLSAAGEFPVPVLTGALPAANAALASQTYVPPANDALLCADTYSVPPASARLPAKRTSASVPPKDA